MVHPFPLAGALLVSQTSISAERGPGAMVAAPCACSPSIARRKRNAYCWPISCLKLKNEAPAAGREPSGGRRLSIGCSRKKTTWALERPHVEGERNNQLKGNRVRRRRRKKLIHRLIIIEAKPANGCPRDNGAVNLPPDDES